jgi:membrane-bound lytic murein transglycosylase B
MMTIAPKGKLSRNPGRGTAYSRLIPVLALAAIWLALAGSAGAAAAPAFDPLLAPVKTYLVSQGLPAGQAEALLAHHEVRFEAKLLARMLARPERPMDYRQFLLPETVARAKQYARQQAQVLAAAQGRGGVPPEVVVAILTIESGLGTYTGKWSTVGVLASQAVLDSPPARRQLAQVWPKKQRAYLATPACGERFQRRAAWAKSELWTLIQIAMARGVSPLSFKGSPAGALGMPQFMPSSLLKWGTDGDQDGRVDLTQNADAIHSVAVYLAAHGWRAGMSRQEQYEVVYTYNHSQAYVNTVLDLAAKIR